MIENRIRVVLAAGNGHGEAVITTILFSLRERVFRALKMGLCVAAISILCVAIPVAHFVLVPIGVLSIPLAAWFAFRTESIVRPGTISCPACTTLVQLTGRRFAARLYENCPACSREIEIRPVS